MLVAIIEQYHMYAEITVLPLRDLHGNENCTVSIRSQQSRYIDLGTTTTTTFSVRTTSQEKKIAEVGVVVSSRYSNTCVVFFLRDY
jgi:hypothetical protein